MRVLILSDAIYRGQQGSQSRYVPPADVQLDIGDLNRTEDFLFSVFDFDVSIVHIAKPYYHTIGYYTNLPKLQRDSLRALENGRSIICLPGSDNFTTSSGDRQGMTAYGWLKTLGVELQDNCGVAIKPIGAGRAQVVGDYLRRAPSYYQIVAKPAAAPASKLAVVDDTGIVVGLEQEIGGGTLVILPPPVLGGGEYWQSMSALVALARRYCERAQRHIGVGDSPGWLDGYLVARARELTEEIRKLADEKSRYEILSYVLYGTGDQLETSVAVLLRELGLEVEPQPAGANVDLKARHRGLGMGFAVEVTGTKGTLSKDSNKVGQAWQYFHDRAGTPEENDRLVIIANTQCHLDPTERSGQAFSPEVAKLLGDGGALLVTTVQLYGLWKAVHEGQARPEDVVRQLHGTSGVYSHPT